MGMKLIIRELLKGKHVDQRQPVGYVFPQTGASWMTLPSLLSHIQARWILQSLEDTVSWARMKFKPNKSRCLIIRKGEVTDKFPLRIQEEVIPSLKKHSIKCLGKWVDAILKDHNNVNRLRQQVKDRMQTIDKTQLPGKYKDVSAWSAAN